MKDELRTGSFKYHDKCNSLGLYRVKCDQVGEARLFQEMN